MPDPSAPDPYRAPRTDSPLPADPGLALVPGLVGGLRRARQVAPLLLPLVAIQAALDPLLASLLPSEVAVGAGALVGAFASMAAQLGALWALHEAVSGRPATVLEAFGVGWVRTIEGWFAVATWTAALLLGFVLLVLPGLWVLTRTAFLLHAIAIERKGVDRAWELTAGVRLGPLALLQWTSWGLAWVAVFVVQAALGQLVGPDEPVIHWVAGIGATVPGIACAFALYDPYRRLAGS